MEEEEKGRDTDVIEGFKYRLRENCVSIAHMSSQDRFMKDFVNGLSQEEIQYAIDELKRNREFYKRILKEERRAKNPNSYRYEDALKQIDKYNKQGKFLSQHLNK